MAKPLELTYVVMKPVKVNGQIRARGEVIPEAESWPKLDAYLDNGVVMAMPKASVPADCWPARAQEPIPKAADVGFGLTAADMTIQEVKEKVTSGELTREQVYEAESTKSNPRATLMRWLYEDE